MAGVIIVIAGLTAVLLMELVPRLIAHRERMAKIRAGLPEDPADEFPNDGGNTE